MKLFSILAGMFAVAVSPPQGRAKRTPKDEIIHIIAEEGIKQGKRALRRRKAKKAKGDQA